MGNMKREYSKGERLRKLEEDRITDPSRGDSLAVCLYCGVVFVAEMVATDIMALATLTARDVFRGQKCVYCLKNRPETEDSEYRLVIGPLMPPVIEKGARG